MILSIIGSRHLNVNLKDYIKLDKIDKIITGGAYGIDKCAERFAQENKIPLLYASSAAVYGGSDVFKEDRKYEKPLNVYGYSKFLFDQVLRRHIKKGLKAQTVGFRYFNVYGINEQHKGRMASVAFHHFHQYPLIDEENQSLS